LRQRGMRWPPCLAPRGRPWSTSALVRRPHAQGPSVVAMRCMCRAGASGRSGGLPSRLTASSPVTWPVRAPSPSPSVLSSQAGARCSLRPFTRTTLGVGAAPPRSSGVGAIAAPVAAPPPVAAGGRGGGGFVGRPGPSPSAMRRAWWSARARSWPQHQPQRPGFRRQLHRGLGARTRTEGWRSVITVPWPLRLLLQPCVQRFRTPQPRLRVGGWEPPRTQWAVGEGGRVRRRRGLLSHASPSSGLP